MAFAEPFQEANDDTLESLSRQIGKFLSDTPIQKTTRRIGLGSSFAIWQLDPEHFDSRTPTLPSEPTAFWHYQVFLDLKPLAHAVVLETEGRLKVWEVAVSALAEKVDKAIEWVDANDKDETPVNFLVAPSCLVYAFLLVYSDIVYVIAAPSPPFGLPKQKRLSAEMLLSKNEFLERLRSLHKSLQFPKERAEKQGQRRVKKDG